MTTKEAMDHLRKAIKEDAAYAWSWHCNIAVCAMDEGLSHERANKAAERFMWVAFEANVKDYSPDTWPKSDIVPEI